MASLMCQKFQKAMHKTSQDIPGVICFLDNILIVSKGCVEDRKRTVENICKNWIRKALI